MAANENGTNKSLIGLHTRFLEILPKIETHARITFRYIRCHHTRQDAIAETVAICWKWFLRLIEQGKDPTQFPSVLAAYAVRHVKAGRRLCGQEKPLDVLSVAVSSLTRCSQGCFALLTKIVKTGAAGGGSFC